MESHHLERVCNPPPGCSATVPCGTVTTFVPQRCTQSDDALPHIFWGDRSDTPYLRVAKYGPVGETRTRVT